ncbi:MAG: transglycosylase domain-containing protein [Actinophytocola sp.]|uniref:transglycosylase domain-containing protein n=1 Tax=Actinophytocola sp. TaxID=1872138 RepID=UPI003C77D0EE
MRTRGNLFRILGLCLLAGALVAGTLLPVAAVAGMVTNEASETVESLSAELADDPPPLVTTITDREDNPIATLYDQYRIPTASDEISDAMKWALISVEDRRFYEHHGVDWKGTVRAALNNSSGGDTQGASTLTQQYVKNYLINVTYRNDKAGQERAQETSITRKLTEARIAIQLETTMSKDEILAGYLNVVEFSRQVYGVGAAARSYFGTTPDKLTVAQGALLAGMANNPSIYDPWSHPERALDRRNFAVDKMVANRKLSTEDAKEVKAEPLGVLPDGPAKPAANCVGAGPEHGFFCQYVQDYLLEHGMSEDDLYTGGYTIHTTLDPAANHAAKESAEQQVDKTEENVANTLSLVKPGKDRHEVVALAANRDYGPDAAAGQTEFALPSAISNVTGTGSSYKVFTAAAAMERGVAGIHDTVQSPSSHTSDVFVGGGSQCPSVARGTWAYCVTNASEGGSGAMSLQTALQTSPNTAFVILEEKAGMAAVLAMANRLGMRKTMAANAATGAAPDPGADSAEGRQSQTEFFGPSENSAGKGSFTLGVSPTSGLELANVAATILSGGVWCPPTPLNGVTDRHGKPYPVKEEPCEQAVPEGLANTLAVGMSKDDLAGGTAHAAAQGVGWTRPMIGKTGTTQHNGSAAFIGGTPQLAGAAMVFRPDRPYGGLIDGGPGDVTATDNDSGNMFGGMTPARTWFGAMSKILDGQEVLPLPTPDPKFERTN